MDAVQQREFEVILEHLQQPDATPQQRQHAQAFALLLQNPVDFSEMDPKQLAEATDANGRKQLALQRRLAQLQHILDHSKSPTAQVVACNSLTALITHHWDNNTLPHIEIRNYALSFLFTQAGAPTVPGYVVRAMTRLLSRITRLGWLSCEAHRHVLDELKRFYDASIEHYVMGLQLMFDLVEELDVPAHTRRELILKRQFLTMALLKIFKTSIETLQKLETLMIPERHKAASLTDAALQLAVRSLSYDFLGQAGSSGGGSMPAADESETQTLAIPLSWKTDIANPALADLLFSIFYKYSAPQSARALELLLLLASVPRALYDSALKYVDVSGRVFTGVRDILSTRRGMDERENHHTFCRLLGALRDVDYIGRQRKGNEYREWLTLASNFTRDAFRDIETPANSMHYLLQFWSRLVASTRMNAMGMGMGGGGGGAGLLARLVSLHAGADEEALELDRSKSAIVHEFVPAVVDAFIAGRLDSVEAAAEGRIEDPLDDVEMLLSQLEVLPRMAALQYSDIGGRLVQTIDLLQPMYEHALATGNAPQVRLLEAKLAWLVRVCAAMVGGHYTLETQIKIEGSRVLPSPVMGTNMQEGDELVDADVSRRMLQLIMLVQNTAASRRCDFRLELALLSFMDKLKQGLLYVDAAMEQDKDSASSREKDADAAQTASMPQFLQSLLGPKRQQTTLPREMYKGIFKRIGLGGHLEVLGIIMGKVVNNLKVWADHAVVIKETLVLLATLVQGNVGEGAARILLELDVTRTLLRQHTSEYISFLSYSANARHRTTYYLTLTHLLAIHLEDADASGAFEAFLQPILATLTRLQATANLRSEEARFQLIGVARDVRGITCATNRRLFPVMFDLLYPACLPVFTRAIDTWWDDPAVTVAVLKMWMEMAENKEARIYFDAAFPGGLLLFKEMAASITSFCRHMLAQGPVRENQDAYKLRYKSIGVCLASMALALTGQYVAFGAFTLYGDKTVDEVVGLLMLLALSIPKHDLIAFHKVATAFYSFQEALFRHALSLVISLETNTVVQLLQLLHFGLSNALQTNVHILCARSIDRFASFLFRNRVRKTPLSLRMQQHMQQVPGLLEDLQLVLLKQIVTDEHTDLGILAHPLLSLILASGEAFQAVTSKFVMKQQAAVQESVRSGFDELMKGVERNLEVENRRRFLRNVQAYRMQLKSVEELVLD